MPQRHDSSERRPRGWCEWQGSIPFNKDGKTIALTGGLGLPTPQPVWLLRTPAQNWAALTGQSEARNAAGTYVSPRSPVPRASP